MHSNDIYAANSLKAQLSRNEKIFTCDLWFLRKPKWIFIALIKLQSYAYHNSHTDLISNIDANVGGVLKRLLSKNEEEEGKGGKFLCSNYYYTFRTYYKMTYNGLPLAQMHFKLF